MTDRKVKKIGRGAPVRISWDRMEHDWRKGVKSYRKIAADHLEATGEKVTAMAVMNHFRSEGIERDLKAQIKERTDEIINGQLVNKELVDRKTGKPACKPNKGVVNVNQTYDENEIVQAVADNNASIVIKERADVARALTNTEKLFKLAECQINEMGDFERLGELLEGEHTAELNRIFRQTVSFGGMVRHNKMLVESLKVGIELQRKVHGIDSEDKPANSIEDVLRRIHVS